MGLADRLEAAKADPKVVKAQLAQLADAFRDAGLDPLDLGAVERIKFYEGFHKTEDGDAQVVPMVAFHIDPAWRTGPDWPVVAPAAPTTVRYGRKRPPKVDDGWRTAVVLPDPQIGYRALGDLPDVELDPFHDEAAMAIAVDVIRAARADVVVNLGDFLDFPEWGTYEQLPEFQATTQPAIDRAHRFLAEQRAAAGPDAELVLLEGNHDRRLPKAIARNALAALRLRQAEEPDGWPVLSVPHVLRLDDLGVTYVDGYPAAAYWLNDHVATVHGHKVNSGGSTAWRVIEDELVSVLFGHVHRVELVVKAARARDGRRTRLAASPGCLCRTDGAVPGAKSSTDLYGRPVSTVENWQQGVAVVTYDPTGSAHHVELVPIHGPGDGSAAWALWRGRRFAAGS